jgi:predicted RNA polymerase sigma factor
MKGEAQARSTVEAVARRSYGKLVAFLAVHTRDVAAAEDACRRRSLRRWQIGR